MSSKYDVYMHPKKGHWGFRSEGQSISIVNIDDSGLLTRTAIKPLDLAAQIAKHVRTGFAPAKRALYLHVRENEGQEFGVFDGVHPELTHPRDLDLLLNLVLTSDAEPKGLSMAMAYYLSKSPALLSSAQEWLKKLAGCSTYLASFVDQPGFSLVLAQIARENNYMLLAMGSPPKQAPSVDPTGWCNYLQQWFSITHIQKAQQDLGWSVKSVLQQNTDTALTAAQPNKTTPTDSQSWIEQANEVSF